jgi:hypothetical protein
MNIWPGWRLTIRLERSTTRRCRFTLQTAGGPQRCIFNAGHPPHGHTCIGDLTAPAVQSSGMLPDRTR